MRMRVAAAVLAVLTSVCAGTDPAPTSTVPPSTTTTAQSMSVPSTAAPTTATLSPPVLSPEAEAFLLEAIEAVSTLSINRDRIDWDATRDRVVRSVDGAVTTADVYPAVRLLLAMVADDHSFFFTPEEAADWDEGRADYIEPVVEVRDGGIGFVSIGYFRGNLGQDADAYASSLATAIEDRYGRQCGWILDLRRNSGGNMWPMLAGLSPLLTDGTVGGFTYPDGTVETWEVRDGASLWRGETMTVSGVEPDGSLPVAVLIGPSTASSGEAVAVAFRNQPGTALIGQPSAGLTTSNEPLWLSDGSMIALTQSVFTDRTGHAFGQGVKIPPGEEVSVRDAESVATAWLSDRCGE